MRSKLMSGVAVAALAPTVLLGQAHDGHAAHNAASPHTITLVYTDYSFADMPDTVSAGMVTLRGVNEGKEPHQAMVVRLGDGHTADELMRALQNPGPPPSWMHIEGGPQVGADVMLNLVPGQYVLLCMIPSPDGTPHAMKGMVRPFTVVPSSAAAVSPPVVDLDLTMANYDWTMSKPLKAGRNVIKVTTAPGQPHELVIAHLLPGKGAKDIAAWEENMSGGPPPFDFITGNSPLGGGGTNYLTVDLKPGRYALVCFLPDAADGKSHLAHGMIREIFVR
jgi:hypothetical protein